MKPSGELNLGLLLLLPWYLILAALYWCFPRTPRGSARRTFDLCALAVAAIATIASLHWSFATASLAYGGMWRQVLATSVSYGVFLAVMTGAWFVRRRVLSHPELPA